MRDRQLRAQADLLSALETLERDFADGEMEENAYRRTRERYELEAARLLEQLEESQEENEGPQLRTRNSKLETRNSKLEAFNSRRLPLLLAGLAIAGALALFLASSLNGRSSGQSITGSQPRSAPTPLPARARELIAARRAVRLHPHNLDDLLRLANAFVDVNDAPAAERTYRRAEALDPSRPQAPTLLALLLAGTNRGAAALALLVRVERSNPGFARAWLVDGLISQRTIGTYRRAVADWRRFLRLVPRGPVATQVRAFLAKLCQPPGPARLRSACKTTP